MISVVKPARYRLTEHALFEMQRRKITRELVNKIMKDSEQIVAAYGERKIYQSRITEDHKVWFVRLVIEDWHDPPLVVTVYRTSKLAKYWRES